MDDGGNMYTRYDDVTARCPFFKGSDEKRISCEGFTDGSIVTQSFSSKEKRNKQKSIFCDCRFENCEVYRLLKEKYDE